VPTESNAWIDQSKLNPNVPSYSDSLFSNMPGRSQPPLNINRSDLPNVPTISIKVVGKHNNSTQMPAQPQLQQQTRHYSELPHSQGVQGSTVNIATRSSPQSHISGHICKLCLIISTVQDLTFFTDPGSGPSQQQNVPVPSFSLGRSFGSTRSNFACKFVILNQSYSYNCCARRRNDYQPDWRGTAIVGIALVEDDELAREVGSG